MDGTVSTSQIKSNRCFDHTPDHRDRLVSRMSTDRLVLYARDAKRFCVYDIYNLNPRSARYWATVLYRCKRELEYRMLTRPVFELLQGGDNAKKEEANNDSTTNASD